MSARLSFLLFAAVIGCGERIVTRETKLAILHADGAMRAIDFAASSALQLASLETQAASYASGGPEGSLQLGSIPFPDDRLGVPGVVIATSLPRPLSGCLRQTATAIAVVATGSGACNAPDHLELDFVDGGVAFVSWRTPSILRMDVVAGHWSGTFMEIGPPGHLRGTIRADPAIFASGIDADTEWQIATTAQHDPNSGFLSGFNVDADGETTDRITSMHAVSHASLRNGSITGSARVEMLDPAGTATHAIELREVSIAVIGGNEAGGVFYDGEHVGGLAPRTQIAWNDGTEDSFFGFDWVPTPPLL